MQAASILRDADIVAHAPFFQAKLDAAHVVVAAIPVLPATSGFLAVSKPSAEELQAAVAAIIGTLILTPPHGTAHVHTPHCEHSKPIPVASAPSALTAHVHTTTCNHAELPAAALMAAAKAGDKAGVDAALASGESTHQKDEVRAI